MKKQINEAIKTCKWRGHDMDTFSFILTDVAISSCRKCNMTVTVTKNPSPNSITIQGKAVALNCI